MAAPFKLLYPLNPRSYIQAQYEALQLRRSSTFSAKMMSNIMLGTERESEKFEPFIGNTHPKL
jgi:hypothetical protein